MSATAISAVIPLRNRTGIRLENCLRSLRWQELQAPADLEIVLSDFGSDPEHASSIDAIAKKYGARVVRTRTEETWNRSRALNVALRSVQTPISLCTDADMLFESNFVRSILDALGDAPGRALVLCRCRDLPDLGPERPFEERDYPELKVRASMRVAMGTGACQATATDWFSSVGGYDEKYVYWGFEDKDMVHRAAKAGLELLWIHERTSMLHQWHPRTIADRRVRVYLNKIRYYLTRGIIVKNSNRAT
jgi:glycosyltransferase involved in cell wall biosynthesis